MAIVAPLQLMQTDLLPGFLEYAIQLAKFITANSMANRFLLADEDNASKQHSSGMNSKGELCVLLEECGTPGWAHGRFRYNYPYC